jgi:hypothetical protein
VIFYLGTHETSWLARTAVPLFISQRRLAKRKALPRALGPWALDSGGFSELSMYGRWQTTGFEYVRAVRRYRDEIGQLQWAAPQDWMCEPAILAKTGSTIGEHQRRTIGNLLALRWADPALPFIPVLQGWHLDDYLRHVDAYSASGVDLASEPLVGVGSVCRRQATGAIDVIVEALQQRGLHLHGFGVKHAGLVRYADLLASVDSMAWSYGARLVPPMLGHTHVTCSNCMAYALRWRASRLRQLEQRQMRLAL